MRVLVNSFVIAAICSVGVSLAAQAPAKEHTMSGCVQKGAAPDTFIVENNSGKGPKVIGIVESKDNLTPHVGHQIEITGVNVPAEEAMKMKNAQKADHYMRLSAIKMVAASCK